jgi:hypothetical protein
MTRDELLKKAEQYRKLAAKATPGERTALLRKARNCYDDAGLGGMARMCERFMG